jgi:hypothetical protein
LYFSSRSTTVKSTSRAGLETAKFAVRGADAAGGWLFTALRSLATEAAVGIAAAGLVLSVVLGRTQERRAKL